MRRAILLAYYSDYTKVCITYWHTSRNISLCLPERVKKLFFDKTSLKNRLAAWQSRSTGCLAQKWYISCEKKPKPKPKLKTQPELEYQNQKCSLYLRCLNKVDSIF